MLTIRLEGNQMFYVMGHSKVFIEIDNAGTLLINLVEILRGATCRAQGNCQGGRCLRMPDRSPRVLVGT